MAFAWFLVILAALVSKLMASRRGHGGKAPETSQPMSSDDSDIESVDWDKIVKDAELAAAEADMAALKKKAPMSSSPKIRQYTRRTRSRNAGIRINEPNVGGPSSMHQFVTPKTEPTWTEGRPAPSSIPMGNTSRNDVCISSIVQEQRRLSSEQERMCVALQHITTDQEKIRKKCSKLSKLLKAMIEKLGCSSSDD